MPVSAFNNAYKIAPITIQEIKYGRNIKLCETLINNLLVISPSITAIATAIIVPTIKNNILYITVSLVDLIAVDKLLKKNLKFL